MVHYQILLERLKSKYMTQVYRNESDRQHQKRKRARKRFISEHPFCNFCGAVDKLTIDHIIPKSKIKRRHNQSNWQVLCEKCNYKKKDKILLTHLKVIRYMNQHKPNCSINIRCAVYHADGVCNHPVYGKCNCGADFPSQPNSEDGKMMYGNSSGNEVQFSHSPKPEEHKMNCELNIGRLESDPMPKCTCTPLPDTTEEKCKFCNGRRKQACDHIKNQELCKCIGWAKCSECQNPFLE